MESKKIFIRGLIFIGILLVIYFPSVVLMSKLKYKGKPLICRTADIYKLKGGNTYQKFKEFNKDKRYDIIVIGSSQAYRGYDPRNFKKEGLNIFNLGTSGQSPLNSFVIAKNYITSQNCSLVLFDVYDGIFNGTGFESTSDLIQNLSSGKAAIEMASKNNNPQVLNMLALRILNSNSPPTFIDSSYVAGGFTQKNDTLRYSLPFEEYESYYAPSPDQIEYFEKTLQYFKEKNIPVILTSLPFPKEKSKKEHYKYAQIFDSAAKKFGIKYLDYSFNTDFDSELHFFDSHHLNQSGVNLFNEILLKDLHKMNYIK